ncbi:MAG: chemotaxis-specific methylesterase [Methanocella sp. PtaU1.Bin125]|nr:MAG: chemotaxis-specific methylesterase [Methanocella sp. PtaU1.Bin125]
MGKTLSVAIVDDEKELVVILTKGFTRQGVEVVFVAYNGREAVELFNKMEKKPDVIIMDYSMPIVDGITAARQILAIAPNVKIIFLSGARLEEKEALETGAFALLRKPVSLYTLVETVREIA